MSRPSGSSSPCDVDRRAPRRLARPTPVTVAGSDCSVAAVWWPDYFVFARTPDRLRRANPRRVDYEERMRTLGSDDA